MTPRRISLSFEPIAGFSGVIGETGRNLQPIRPIG